MLKPFSIAFLLLTFAVLILVGSSSQSKEPQSVGGSGPAKTVNLTSRSSQQPVAEKATPIKENEKTEKQKINGKLFSGHKTKRNLRELARGGSGEIIVKSIIYPPFRKGETKCPSYPSQDLTSYAHQADIVIIGLMTGKNYSQLTEDGDFIYSEYNVKVEEVLKNDARVPVGPGANISAVRPGGRVSLNEREIQAIAGRFMPFKDGERYLLFLRYVSQTGVYLAYGGGSFHLRDKQVYGLATGHSLPKDASSFIAEVRAAIASTPCANRALY